MPWDSIDKWRDEDEQYFFTESAMKKLWVDDIRLPPNDEWTWVKTSSDAIQEICTGEYRLVSLDHDLGSAKTGYDVLCAVERQIAKGGWWHALPEFRVHSANPVGRANMLRAITSIQKLVHALGIN